MSYIVVMLFQSMTCSWAWVSRSPDDANQMSEFTIDIMDQVSKTRNQLVQ